MYEYIVGKVAETSAEKVILEVQGLGYQLLCPNPFAFPTGEVMKVYTYQHVREDFIGLYGFKTKDERDVFINMLGVSGIGPKGALAVLASGRPNDVITAIEDENETYLTKFPGVGKKTARRIILDLKGKFKDRITLFNAEQEAAASIESNTPSALQEAADALSALGYSDREIKRVWPKLKGLNLTSEAYVKEALKLMLNS